MILIQHLYRHTPRMIPARLSAKRLVPAPIMNSLKWIFPQIGPNTNAEMDGNPARDFLTPLSLFLFVTCCGALAGRLVDR